MTFSSHPPNSYHFSCNSTFQAFDQYSLSKNDEKMLNIIEHANDLSKKVNSLIVGCIKRNNKLLYKGDKYYIQDLQIILDKFPDVAPQLMKSHNITLNKSHTKVCVQCQNCASFTEVWKFCPTCQHVHYCHEGCEMKIKFTHEREQCRVRPFPKTYKGLQVEVYVGSDLGQNVQLCFQHQLSMSLLLRGEQLLEEVLTFFTITPEGKGVLNEYQVKSENKSLKFEKPLVKPLTIANGSISIESIDDISKIYTNNKILRALQVYFLERGGILWKNIREIHDNHLRQVFLFRLG